MVVVALLSVDLVESVDLVSVDLVVNCIQFSSIQIKTATKIHELFICRNLHNTCICLKAYDLRV